MTSLPFRWAKHARPTWSVKFVTLTPLVSTELANVLCRVQSVAPRTPVVTMTHSNVEVVNVFRGILFATRIKIATTAQTKNIA